MKIHKKNKLGRWNIGTINSEVNSEEQMRKVDLANCDSCGSCKPENKTEDFIKHNLIVLPHH